MEHCKHYFEWVYTTEPVVYCIKCNKEIDDIGIPFTILRNYDVIDGKFVLKQIPISKKLTSWQKIKNIFKIEFSC